MSAIPIFFILHITLFLFVGQLPGNFCIFGPRKPLVAWYHQQLREFIACAFFLGVHSNLKRDEFKTYFVTICVENSGGTSRGMAHTIFLT